MKNLAAGCLIILLMLTGCGKGSDPTRTPSGFVPVTSIRIVAEYPKIAAKTSMRLKVIGNHSGVYESDLTSQAVWTSEASTFADFVTTAQPDRITGLLPGPAVITAKVGAMTATYPLTVSGAKITSISISPLNPQVNAGLTTQLTAYGTFDDNAKQDISYDATWSADTSGFASVSDIPGNKGLAKGLKKGTATLTASFEGVPENVQLTVLDPLLVNLIINEVNQSVDVFSLITLTANGIYSDSQTPKLVSTGLKWVSSNDKVAAVAADTGIVSIKGVGTTTIGVSSGTVTATSTNLTVKDFSLSFTTSKSPMNVTEKLPFKVTATSVGRTGQDVTTNSEWQSNSSNFITVGNATGDKGVVTAVAVGQDTITVTYGGKSTTFTVTVQ